MIVGGKRLILKERNLNYKAPGQYVDLVKERLIVNTAEIYFEAIIA